MDPLKAPTTQESKLHFLDYWRIIRIRKTVILAVFLLVVITATLVTFVMPKYYESKASIRVERTGADVAELSGSRSASGYDPYFIQSEFEVIKSEAVLTNVITSLKLDEKWGKKLNVGQRLKTSDTLDLLRSHLNLRPVRNTMFLDVGIVLDDKNEAAVLANAVAEAYESHRLAEFKRASEGGIMALQESFELQQKKAKDVSDRVSQLRDELKITDSEAAGTGVSPSIDIATIQLINARLIEDKSELGRKVTRFQVLTNMTHEEKRKAMPTIAPDMQFNEFSAQLNLAEQALIKASKDNQPEHPIYKNAEALVKDLTKKVSDRIDGVIVGLDTEIESLRAGVHSRSNELAIAKATDIARAKETQPYWDKKQERDGLLVFQKFLEQRVAMETVDRNLPRTTMVTIYTRAIPVDKPISPRVTVNIVLGIVIGLLVGVGLAFFIEYLDTSVKTIDDVERALQSPVLGVIPQNVGLLIKEGAESPHAEAYRVLRTNILFSRKDEKLNCLAVVSAGAGEGKSTTIFNLATIFAQSGQRVIIVDSDLRRPTLHKMINVSNATGLTNYLLKQNTLEEVIQTTSIPTLDFMASGKLPSSSLGILSSSQMKDLINELKVRYDFVFFDSPPIMGVSDASILASEVAMTIQVIQYRRYPQPMNIRAKQMIEKVGGNLIGIVLNNINMSQDESYYYYSGYYHDYYYSRNEDSDDKAAPASGDKDKAAKPGEIKQKY